MTLPEPMTPPDCDLRDFGFMPLDVSRLRDSDLAAEATGDEFRAAVLLWCASWHQVPAASLPNDERSLAHLSGYGRDVKGWRKVSSGALRGFMLCSDGRLYHALIAEKAAEAWASRERFSEKRERDRERLKEWREKQRETRMKHVSSALHETSGNAGETPKRGTGERDTIPLDKSNGRSPTFLPEPEPALADPERQFWVGATGYLGASKRPLIGRWVKQYGRSETAKAIAAAQVERAVDPPAYIERLLRGAQTADNLAC